MKKAAKTDLWRWMFVCLLIGGCAADKSGGSVQRSVETPQATPQSSPGPSSPSVQERAKKTPPPAPRQERREESSKPERAEVRPELPSAQPQPDQPKTEPRSEPQPEQHAKIPADRITPMDQSGSKDDVEVTRRIRQALMNEDLSFGAKNVLVITEQDRVVLKGNVKSASEAERVKGIAGMMTTKQIEDRLEVGKK